MFAYIVLVTSIIFFPSLTRFPFEEVTTYSPLVHGVIPFRKAAQDLGRSASATPVIMKNGLFLSKLITAKLHSLLLLECSTSSRLGFEMLSFGFTQNCDWLEKSHEDRWQKWRLGQVYRGQGLAYGWGDQVALENGDPQTQRDIKTHLALEVEIAYFSLAPVFFLFCSREI